MKPPKDITGADLFRKLCQSPRPSEIVDFPRFDPRGMSMGKVRIEVLSFDEHDEARLFATEWLRDVKGFPVAEHGSPALAQVLADATARFVLCSAIKGTEPIGGEDAEGELIYPRVFPEPSDLGKLTADEITILFSTYTLIQQKYGPYEGNIETEADLNAWINRLAEGAAESPLARLSSRQWVELIRCLAQRAYSASALLASQRENLPTTFAPILDAWGIGTGSFASRHAVSTLDGPTLDDVLGLEVAVDDEPEDDDPLPDRIIPPDAEVTMEQAQELAENLFGD